MNIESLNLVNYRNYKKVDLSLSPNINIFIGNNASGKTNILESIYTLALTKSYRAKDEEVILIGEEFYKIKALIDYFNRNESLALIGTDKGKKAFKNDVEIKKLSDFIGLVNVVFFSPDDLMDLKGGPQEKRKMIDYFLLQISKRYVDSYSAYKKELKLRNDYLKYMLPKIKDMDEIKDSMLDVLTENLFNLNKEIEEMRRSFISKLEAITKSKYKELSGDDIELKIEYVTNFENNIEFFKDKYKSDILSGSSQYGCHRDDIKFYKGSYDFMSVSSQGEIRMLALSLKLAYAELLSILKGDPPIVLLDDVLSELDKNHQNRLLRILDRKMQIIITSTDILKLGKLALDNSKIFQINKREIKEIKING